MRDGYGAVRILQPQDVMVVAVFCLLVFLMVAILVAIRSWRKNPFRYPYLRRDIDVSRRRNVDFDLELMDWLHDDANWREVSEHAALVAAWERECRAVAERSVWKTHRLRQLEGTLDARHGYTFALVRQRRSHNRRFTVTEEARHMSFARVRQLRERALARGPVTDEFVRRERAKMTPALRRAVAERDHYTCQECGKHMPDGVGLQIDHIVPVSKGGRTEMGNLQVLCSRCNGRKSNRLRRA